MAVKNITIGTRGSQLALKQTHIVKEMLEQKHPDLSVEVKIIHTQGDRNLSLSLKEGTTKGLFTEELEQQLRDGCIDLAVHSLKDLPVQCNQGTTIGAYLPRAAYNDVWIGRCRLEGLPTDAIIGTSSPRRAAQLLKLYPKVQIKEIRGNVETRIRKCRDGEYDGIIMAQAGLDRLGLSHEITQTFTIEQMLPAPGQGAIAVQIRANDPDIAHLMRSIHCETTAKAVELERAVLNGLGGGCALPFGAAAQYDAGHYHLEAFLSSSDQSVSTRLAIDFDEAQRDEEIRKMIDQLTHNIHDNK